MAFKIIWTEKAQKDRLKILQYWIDRNKSTLFAAKLNEIFNERVELLAQYPNLGKKTDMKQVRAHVVRKYFIFYKLTEKTIVITSIFDTRQDSGKLKRMRH
ncbi:MAG: type II toxin-antitoxin system RelE/ParE family toxin [Bacteroidetes bacterium]|jgi:addiction module RelE/StbE family toxin|nr:type II toxin-antitoxin system RelE/ParE family toxin [Bacteroidota bacterium]